MLTVPEAAARTGYSAETIRRWIRAHKLRSTKMGTQHMIEERDLDAFISGTGVREASVPYEVEALEPLTRSPLLSRIVVSADTCFGKPRIAGTRLAVEFVLDFLAGGQTSEQIAEDYLIAVDDVLACVAYAAETVRSETVSPIAAR